MKKKPMIDVVAGDMIKVAYDGWVRTTSDPDPVTGEINWIDGGGVEVAGSVAMIQEVAPRDV